MSWKRYFTPVEGEAGTRIPFQRGTRNTAHSQDPNYSVFTPMYTQAPNRVERYGQYNVMDPR